MRLVPVLLLAAALVAGCDSGDGDDSRPSPSPEPPAITRAELGEHLDALGRVAAENGGNRAVGTAGYEASVEYVSGALRAAGWRVRVQEFDVPRFELESSSVSVGRTELERARDYQVLTYSGSGEVSGRLQHRRNGCTAENFTDLAEDDVPVVERGTCFFAAKAGNAQRAGAKALVVVDRSETTRGVPSGTLAIQGIRIPVVLVSDSALGGAPDDTRVEVEVRASTARQGSESVIADTPGAAGDRVVMAGGHLDSVAGGPGINDNGSGVAALIEAAEAIGPDPPGAPVRLAFWGAEEVGVAGSRHYVRSLSQEERRRIAAYLNFDMLGSPNAVTDLYVDGAPELNRVLRRVAGLPLGSVAAGGSSDHAPFADAGIPVSGLYTGGPEQGRGGRPRDPCYHLACDTADNVDREVLLRMARAATSALRTLSRQAK
ncbi:MAG TPA: M20/M25/M40 family metallo-hydrolase [Thermoleophilaceae bacterium]|nr:M20/M25/M40 family metallo-hydrolase [Thermoleophilaceae bacterium]